MKDATTISDLAYKNWPFKIEFMDNNSINTVNSFLPCGLDVSKECVLLIDLDGLESTIMSQVEKLKKALSFLVIFSEGDCGIFYLPRRGIVGAVPYHKNIIAARFTYNIYKMMGFDDFFKKIKNLSKNLANAVQLCYTI